MRETQSFFLFFTGLCCLRPCLPLQYHFIDTALPWLKAQNYCRTRFTDLATVFDAESMNLLLGSAQQSGGGFAGKAWIGLHDNLANWRWSFPDSAYYGENGRSFRNWDVGQPDNFFGDQMCVKTFIGGLWEDSSCFLTNPFICYDATASIGKRFVFIAQALNWRDAQLHCRRRYTDLASVRNQEENMQIQRLSSRGAWIGLYRTREWSDGSEFSFQFWTSGQPDNVGGKQSCVATHLGNAGRWSDEECGRSFAFVCSGECVGTTEKPSTTAAPTERTYELSSTAQTDQTTTITEELPTETRVSSAATGRQDKTTTADGDSTLSAQFGTTELDQTASVPEHVIHLGLKFTSKVQLSEEDIKQLLVVEFHKRLVEMGLPSSLKVGLKKTEE